MRARTKNTVEKICDNCGKPFIAKNRNRLFCYPDWGETDCKKAYYDRIRYKETHKV